MLTIGKAASAAGLSVDTIRFYERSGILKPPPRTAGGYRLYRNEDIGRLRFIHRAKALGFSLEEIAQLLLLNDGGGRRRDVRDIAARRLEELDGKITELTRIRHALYHLVNQCDARGSLNGCPIIEALVGPMAGCDVSSNTAGSDRNPQTTNEE